MRREITHLTGEGEYCHRLDADLLEKMRRRAELEDQRLRRVRASAEIQAEADRDCRRIAEELNLSDLELAQSLQELGYTPDTACLVYLTPFVRIAWADGSVSRDERRLISRWAVNQGIVPDTPAFSQLTFWLERRPREAVLGASWTALKLIVESLAPEESSARKECILQRCKAVAAVSGLILHKTCAAERKILMQVEQDLQLAHGVPAAGFP